MNPIIYSNNLQEKLKSTIKSLDEIIKDITKKQILEIYNNSPITESVLNFNLIYENLYDELNQITLYKYREWCELTTSLLITYIEGTLKSLIKLDKIVFFTADELSQLLYLELSYQLYTNKNGIINNIYYDSLESSESSDSSEYESESSDE
jgi:hypothetical protein